LEFVYKIPGHLQGHLEGIPDKQLQALTTMMFEYAINHRMLDYPKLHIERQVDSTLSLLKELQLLTKKDNSHVLDMLLDLNSKVDRIMTIGSIRSYTEEVPTDESDTYAFDSVEDVSEPGLQQESIDLSDGGDDWLDDIEK
jgi:hypothetical protein